MIQYRLAENANLEFDTVRVPGDQTNHSLTSLQRKVYYEVSIAAYTTAGAGPFSKALIQVTDPSEYLTPVNVWEPSISLCNLEESKP